MLNHNRRTSMYKEQGFSLIELLLAMLIGLIIIGGVMSLYLTSRDTQRSSQDQLQLVTDARFVIESLGFDLRHASSWGSTNLQQGIDCQKNYDKCSHGDDLPKATGDCTDWDYIDLRRPIFGTNDANTGDTSGCVTANYKSNTDILQVRYADPTPVATASLATDTVYIRGNAEGGKLFEFNGALPNHGSFYKWESNATNDQVTKNHPMVSHVYYVSEHTEGTDGIPALRRVYLEAGPKMTDEVLISGVEDMQVLYGMPDLDSAVSNKKSIVRYAPADATWTDVDWQKVSAVKIHILLRSDRKDRESEIKQNRTYNYAGKSVASNDGYKRFLISSVVELKNTNRLDEL